MTQSFTLPDDGRSISRNVASLNILVRDVIYKRISGIFFILVRSWVINKNVKRPGFYTLVFYIFINNSRSKQNKKSPRHPSVDIGKKETCAKFQQKILNCRVVWAHQSFQTFRQNTWFLQNNRALSKFLHGILHYLISTIKL